jgi:hypothetical protein
MMTSTCVWDFDKTEVSDTLLTMQESWMGEIDKIVAFSLGSIHTLQLLSSPKDPGT